MPTPQIPRQPQPQKKLAICSEGTYKAKMAEAIRFSEDKRQRVVDLGLEIGGIARTELMRRHEQIGMRPPSQADLDTKADAAVEADARWRVACADEQWGYRLTTMYGIAELVAAANEGNELIRYQNKLMREQLEAQKKTNELLERLVGKLAPQGGNL